MTPTESSRPPAEFWRCGHCGTPNPSASYITHCVACGLRRGAPTAASAARTGPEASASGTARGPRSRSLGIVSVVLAAGYVALVLAALVVVKFSVGPNWLVAPALFAPRGLLLVPAIPLLALAFYARNRPAIGLAGAAAVVVAWPLMGLNLPIGRLAESPAQGLRLRLLSLNLGTEPIDVEAIFRLIERERVDLVFLQERSDPALDAYFAEGWHRDRSGFVASRLPIAESFPALEEESLDQGRYIGSLSQAVVVAPTGVHIRVASVHLPTLRPGFDRLARGDTAGIDLLSEWWARRFSIVIEKLHEGNDAPFLAAGDFNMPADHPAFASIRRSHRLGFEEAGWGYGYTRPSSWSWTRIDHVLTSPEWSVQRCWVGPDVGSDHRPLLAEVILPASPARPASP